MQEFTIKLTAKELKKVLNALENEQRWYLKQAKKSGNIWKTTIALEAEMELEALANTIYRQINEGNCYK